LKLFKNDLDSDRFPSQCDRCLYNTRNPHLPCAVHPYKIVDARCPDFDLDTSLPAVELWEPEGASYYAGELVIEPIQRWPREQKLALLDWHPMFTGRCPNCERSLVQTHPERVHWDCQECEWRE
jgi:hypothetical protein